MEQTMTGMEQNVTGSLQSVTGLEQTMTGLEYFVTGMEQSVTGVEQTCHTCFHSLAVSKHGVDSNARHVQGPVRAAAPREAP